MFRFIFIWGVLERPKVMESPEQQPLPMLCALASCHGGLEMVHLHVLCATHGISIDIHGIFSMIHPTARFVTPGNKSCLPSLSQRKGKSEYALLCDRAEKWHRAHCHVQLSTHLDGCKSLW